MKLVDLRNRLAEGTEWNVTNHYINRPDHPCYGTNRRTILRSTSGGFWLSHETMEKGNLIPWPKAADIEEQDGAILIRGFPSSKDMFLTLTPA